MTNSSHVALAGLALACVAGIASGAALKPEPPKPEPLAPNPRRVSIPIEPDAAALPYAIVASQPLLELRPDGSRAAPLFRSLWPPPAPKVHRTEPREQRDTVFDRAKAAMRRWLGR